MATVDVLPLGRDFVLAARVRRCAVVIPARLRQLDREFEPSFAAAGLVMDDREVFPPIGLGLLRKALRDERATQLREHGVVVDCIALDGLGLRSLDRRRLWFANRRDVRQLVDRMLGSHATRLIRDGVFSLAVVENLRPPPRLRREASAECAVESVHERVVLGRRRILRQRCEHAPTRTLAGLLVVRRCIKERCDAGSLQSSFGFVERHGACVVLANEPREELDAVVVAQRAAVRVGCVAELRELQQSKPTFRRRGRRVIRELRDEIIPRRVRAGDADVLRTRERRDRERAWVTGHCADSATTAYPLPRRVRTTVIVLRLSSPADVLGESAA